MPLASLIGACFIGLACWLFIGAVVYSSTKVAGLGVVFLLMGIGLLYRVYISKNSMW